MSRVGELLEDAICDPDRHLCGTHLPVEEVFIFGAWFDQEELLSGLAYGIHATGKI